MLKDYVVAGSLEEAEKYLDSGNGSFQIVAGGTDVMVDLKKGKSSSEKLLDINKISELKEIREEDGNIIIGGAVTFQEIIESKLINEKLPVLVQACSKVGSWQIRNRGTLAGNIVHAQPAADGAVVMFALGAKARVKRGQSINEYNVTDLYEGLGKSKIDNTRELVKELVVGPLEKNQGASFQKIAKRNSLSLPLINAVTIIRVDENKKISEARVTASPVAPTPKRLSETENNLIGVSIDDDASLRKAAYTAQKEASPRDSLLRGSGEYRKELVKEFIYRGINEAIEEAEGGF